MNRSFAPLALALLALAAPTTASAATRCVPTATPGCDSSHATITQAITAAANGDTVRIAAGTYTEAINTGKRLNFLGAGGGTLESDAGTTTIAPASGTAIILEGGGSLRGLRAVGASGFSGSTALYFYPSANGSYELALTDVVAIGGSGSDTLFGYGGNGATIVSGDAGKPIDLTVSDSQFKAGNSAAPITGTGMTLYGQALTGAISRTRISGSNNDASTGLLADRPKVTIEDSSVTSGIATQLFDGDFTIRRSRLLGTPGTGGGYGWALTTGDTYASTPTKVTVEDSLIVSEPGYAATDSYGIRAYAQSGAEPYTVDVRGSTILSRGAADPDGAVAVIPMGGGTPPEVIVDLRNSVARLEGDAETGEADLVAQHGGIVASSSSFSSAAWAGSGTVPGLASGTNLVGHPKLGPDFAPLPGSPLIDRGDPAVASGGLDVDGAARSQDGTGDCVAIPDIGAFELASRCPKPPVVDTAPPKISKASLSRKRFTARKPVHKGRKRGAKLRFTLSEAASVKLTFERKSNGRRVKVAGKRRCVKPTKRNATKPRCTRHTAAGNLTTSAKAGPNTLALTGKLGRNTLAPGRYRLTLTATDPTGLRSKPLRLSFRILRP